MDLKQGFPDIRGCKMHNHLDCHSPESITLWFYRHDLNAMTDFYVYLLGASLVTAHVELAPFFPDLEGHTIKTANGKQTVHIAFKTGEISFSYEQAFHRVGTKALGRLPPKGRPK